MASRGYGGRFVPASRGEGGPAGGPGATPGILGTAGGPVSGRSLPDAGTLSRQAPYDEVRPAAGAMDDVLACDPVYGMPASPQEAPAGALGSYVGREPAPIGVADGSYALCDAQDLGAPQDTADDGLPALLDGGYDFSARLHQLGDQALIDDLKRLSMIWCKRAEAIWTTGRRHSSAVKWSPGRRRRGTCEGC